MNSGSLNLSPAGFSPEYWGPSLWFIIHLAAANYPLRPTARDRVEYQNFYKSLKRVLPCAGCREDYTAMITRGPLRLTDAVFEDRPTLFAWTVAIHNQVNAKLGKRVRPDVAMWYQHYDSIRSR